MNHLKQVTVGILVVLAWELVLGDNIATYNEQHVALVKASVTGITTDALGDRTAHQRIQQVFLGSHSLTNFSFPCRIPNSLEDMGLHDVLYPNIVVDVGTTGIWAIKITDAGCFPVSFAVCGRVWPSFPDGDKRHSQALKLAEMASSVSQLDSSAVVSRVAGYITNPIPEIAYFASLELASHDNINNYFFEQNQLRKDLPTLSKLVADGIWIKQRGDQWSNSRQRYAMLEDCLRCPMDDFEWFLFVNHIGEIAQQEANAQHKVLLPLIDAMLKNDGISDSRKQSCLFLLERYRDKSEELIELLLSLAKDKNPRTALAAISILRREKNLTEGQMLCLTNSVNWNHFVEKWKQDKARKQ
jgi:hypothetical protein